MQWRKVQLLVVDDASFIGRVFLGRMHLRLQQAKRRQLDEAHIDALGCVQFIRWDWYGHFEKYIFLCPKGTRTWLCEMNLAIHREDTVSVTTWHCEMVAHLEIFPSYSLATLASWSLLAIGACVTQKLAIKTSRSACYTFGVMRSSAKSCSRHLTKP